MFVPFLIMLREGLEAALIVEGQKKKILCLNDANCNVDFEKIEGEIRKSFDQILPEKSSFEI